MKRQFKQTPYYASSRKRTSGAASREIGKRLLWIMILGAVLALLLIFNTKIARLPSLKPQQQATPIPTIDWESVRNQYQAILNKHYVPQEWVRGLNAFNNPATDNPPQIVVRIKYPPQFRIHELVMDFLRLSSHYNYRIIEAYERLSPHKIGITLSARGGASLKFMFTEDKRLEWFPGRVAVIIDDFGYSLDGTVEKFLNTPFPITLAIIPGTEHAREIAERARASRFDVFIHLPMEPLKGRVENRGFTIFTKMNERQIEKVVKKAMEAVPGAIGVNNHMGSKATIDRRTMARLMRVLKRYHLIFVDSVTNRKSIAYQLARQSGVPALRMTTYLDNPESSKNLSQKLEEVIRNLPKNKTAVVIGHARKETAEILPSLMARWAFRGVSFVRIQDLLENP